MPSIPWTADRENLVCSTSQVKNWHKYLHDLHDGKGTRYYLGKWDLFLNHFENKEKKIEQTKSQS